MQALFNLCMLALVCSVSDAFSTPHHGSTWNGFQIRRQDNQIFMSNENVETEIPEQNETPREEKVTSMPQSSRQNMQAQPSAELMMKALNTSPRRLFLGTASSTAIALTANFFGVTSSILASIPEDTVEKTGLDLYYPVGNFKRFRSFEYGYTFVVLKEWVQDTAVELAKIQKKSGNLDYSMRGGRSSASGSIPDVAYGPPGYFNEKGISQSDTNLSTIATRLRPGLTLPGTLGSPTQAAETLLRVSLAPEGSGRKASLIGAKEETRGFGQIYTFEYTVDRGDKGVPLRAISNIAVQGGDTLITMTVVAPLKDWTGDYEQKLRKMAESFKVIK